MRGKFPVKGHFANIRTNLISIAGKSQPKLATKLNKYSPNSFKVHSSHNIEIYQMNMGPKGPHIPFGESDIG